MILTLPKPRVMVVGLLGVQANSVAAELGNDLEMRFFTQEESHQRLTQQAQGADYALVMTKWCSHPTEFAVRRGGCPDFRRVSGGPSDLLRVLRQIKVDWTIRQAITNGSAKA